MLKNLKVAFSKCLVREVPSSLNKGLTTQSNAHTIDMSKAIKDHKDYIQILKKTGLDVSVMPELPDFPDSVFVEDVAIVCKDWAIMVNPAKESRRREKQYIKNHLLSHFAANNPIFKIFDLVSQKEENQDIFLEGGDVIRYGEKHFFVGISERTTIRGFERFEQLIKSIEMGYSASPVPLLDKRLHLKCITSYLGDGEIIGDSKVLSKYPEFKDIPLFDTKDFDGVSNVISVNGHVITQENSPDALKTRLEKRGFKVHLSANNEFAKLDGDITCRSLLV